MQAEGLRLIAQYGAYGISAGLIVVFYFVIRGIQKENSRLLELFIKVNDQWQHTFAQVGINLDSLTTTINKLEQRMDVANTHVRAEHTEVADLLKNTKDGMNEILIALARLNGRKHE